MKLVPVKSVLSKWLLVAVLVAGFFTFSGLTIQITSEVDKPDTTLVAGAVKKASRAILYNAALKTNNQHAFSNLTSRYRSVQILGFLHSRESTIKIKQSYNLFITSKSFRNLSFIRTYCHTTADEAHPSVL